MWHLFQLIKTKKKTQLTEIITILGKTSYIGIIYEVY